MSMNYNEILEKYSAIAQPREFIENFLYIKTKGGKFDKFKLNKPQDRLMKIVEGCLESGKPIRVRILKARQMGFSTFIAALGFWWAAMNLNSSYAVVAHKRDSAESLYQKNKIFYDYLPREMKPNFSRMSSEGMTFDKLRSEIFFGTAGGGELFRGMTILFLHKSEKAFWDDPNGILTASLGSVVPNEAFSAVFEETTANGYNDFKDEWDASVRGTSEFVAFFAGWNEMDEYRMNVPSDFVKSDDEESLAFEYDLDDEQIFWRRYMIDTVYNGDVRKFKQEYPISAEEAFISSGGSVYDSELIGEGYKASIEPELVEVDVHLGTEKLRVWERPEKEVVQEYFKNVVWSDAKQDYEYVEDLTKIIREYTKMTPYTVGVDTAGDGSGDFSVVSVWNNISESKAASFRVEKIKEEQLAKVVVWIAKMYNEAMIVPEVNFSYGIVDEILKLEYKNIYMEEQRERVGGKISMKYGWRTTVSNKPSMVTNLRSHLNEYPYKNKDKEFWYEAEYFLASESKITGRIKYGAAPKHYDDIIMADSLAYQGVISLQAKKGYAIRRGSEKSSMGKSFRGIIGREKKKAKKLERGVYRNDA